MDIAIGTALLLAGLVARLLVLPAQLRNIKAGQYISRTTADVLASHGHDSQELANLPRRPDIVAVAPATYVLPVLIAAGLVGASALSYILLDGVPYRHISDLSSPDWSAKSVAGCAIMGGIAGINALNVNRWLISVTFTATASAGLCLVLPAGAMLFYAGFMGSSILTLPWTLREVG